MPKELKKTMYAYAQKYVPTWEREAMFKGWLKPSPDGDSKKAFCAYCKSILNAHKKGLISHGNSIKHKQCGSNREQDLKLPKIDKFAKITLSEKRKIAELRIAAFVAEHSSIKAVDHLSQVIKSLDDESAVLQDIKLHRTKCSALIKNILSPCIVEELIADVGDVHYSLIIDESTTVDTKKVLCIMIRYFSEAKKKIVTSLYRLVELEAGTSDAITAAILKQLEKDGLRPKKLLGLGVDGASVNVGKNHSVTTILRSINPELVVIKYICHSLHLAAEEACEVLPAHLDFMVRETHGWFCHSTKRQLEYAEIYKVISGELPKKIVKLSKTRWLVRLQAIDIILEQWDVLKLHFEFAASNRSEERCHVARQLQVMYADSGNKVYLTFLKNSLKGVMGLNKLFQSNSVDPVKLFEDLNNVIYNILRTLVIPSQLAKLPQYQLADYDFKQYCMPLSCVNFGNDFNKLCTTLKSESVVQIKRRCQEFLVHLCSALQARVPENMKILHQITVFSPQAATSRVKSDITEIAEQFVKSFCTDIDSTVKEWNLLHGAQVTNISDTEKYWAEVNEIKDAGGNKRFGNISKLALGLLSLPFSNAAVECAFSVVNIVKDKLRNSMSITMVKAIMHVRCTLNVECFNFKPTADMLKRFTSENVYSQANENDAEVLDIFADE